MMHCVNCGFMFSILYPEKQDIIDRCPNIIMCPICNAMVEPFKHRIGPYGNINTIYMQE